MRTTEAESTLTDRCQTTVPETVRRALRLRERDKIRYSIRPRKEVMLNAPVMQRPTIRFWAGSRAYRRSISPTILTARMQ
jgi:bifunctional DNA-binding transcriptional regulator/antitoxin component of YhaV-PrlF toxin-antitoxin module